MRTTAGQQLSRPYRSRDGAPVLTVVNPEIFALTYAGACMSANCDDNCCRHGVDADTAAVRRLSTHNGAMIDCFGGEVADDEFPGGGFRRTCSGPKGCTFLRAHDRGCRLHGLGVDCHEFKPMMCFLFPCTFDEGELHAANEARDGSLICLGQGISLYRGIRDDLRHYFGNALIAELDWHEEYS